MSLGPEVTLDVQPEFGEAEYWMAGRMRQCIASATKAIEQFRFHEAAETLYHLVWDDFCSTYIELAKVALKNGTSAQKAAILHFLDILLRTLHPFVPYVTEEIHEAVLVDRLAEGEPRLLAERGWPMGHPILDMKGGDSGLIPKFQEALSSILRLKAENSVDPAKRVQALCSLRELAPFADALKSLAKLESVAFQDGDLSSRTRAIAIIEGGMVALELAGVKNTAAEKAKLEKERDRLSREIQSLKERLGNSDFLEKAAPKAIEAQKSLAAEKEARLAAVLGVLGE
jgi:valyl-tRNA synthetase